MTKFETSVLDAQYYVHTVLVESPTALEGVEFSMYSPFKNTLAVQALLGSVNPNVLVTIRETVPCPIGYQKSSYHKHYSMHQMFAILSTIRFTRLETRKKYKIIEVSETVEVDYTDGTEKTVSQTKDKVFNSWEEFEEAIVDMMIQKEGEK